jgi:hypothetical protein
VYGLIPKIPDDVSVGFENSTGALGANYFFNSPSVSEGAAPVAGIDLQTATTVGGTATLTFDAIVSGPAGGNILNEATMTNSTTNEKAVAYTTINDKGIPDTDKDGIYDDVDNCTKVPNANQCDSDHDRYGNACDADFNNNGFVNEKDISIITKNIFKRSHAPEFSPYDMNCSGGRVDFEDYIMALVRYGKQPGPSGLVGKDLPKQMRD